MYFHPHPDSLVLNPRLLCSVGNAAVAREVEPRARRMRLKVHLACIGVQLQSSRHLSIAAEGLPRSAINNDVFPLPVGPMIKLIPPRLNQSSGSTRSLKLRREGVSRPSASLDHANVASRKPIALMSSSATPVIASTTGAFSLNWSRSSVYR